MSPLPVGPQVEPAEDQTHPVLKQLEQSRNTDPQKFAQVVQISDERDDVRKCLSPAGCASCRSAASRR